MINAGRINENFETTEKLSLIWELSAQPDNIVFHTPDAELEGMRYFDSEYRWPSVYGFNGTITLTVPRAGTFYPGVVVYDGDAPRGVYAPHKKHTPSGSGSYEMNIDGKVVGRFYPCAQDNRQRLFFLSHPVEFKGGERITLCTGSTGPHLVEDIMLLRTRPPVRKREFAIKNIEAGLVQRDGRDEMRVTWITTWPAQCTLEYATSSGRMERVAEQEPLCNHRVYLINLEPGAVCRYRIIAPKPDASTVESEEMTFTFAPPPLFEGTVSRASITLRVQNPYDFHVSGYPVSSGVPFAKGELGDARHVKLLAPDRKPVPLQADVSARWPDGSVKWVLISFQADVGAGESALYALEYGAEVSLPQYETPLSVSKDGKRVTVNTGPLEVEFDGQRSGFPVRVALNGRQMIDGPTEARIVGGEGTVYTSSNPADLLEIEEAGPIRVVVHSKGHHRSDAGERFFVYEARFVFYADAPFLRTYYAWGNDREELFSQFDDISISVPLSGEQVPQWALGLRHGKQASGGGDVDLRQLRHDCFELSVAPSPDAALRRAEGWIDAKSGEAGLILAVRDFWQLYPKALTVKGSKVLAGLCPDFEDGTYDNAESAEIDSYYFYLLGGKYKIQRGVKKWHELMLLFHEGETTAARHIQTVAAFQEPLIAVCPPERYCGTRVFGPLVPAGTGKTERFDGQCESFGDGYLKNREERTLYGMLNFGDSFRAPGMWLNDEYDPAHGFLLMFARTAKRKWYFLAEKAVRHAIDVDTCHYGPRTGAEWAHCAGHTGGPITPSHTWTEGFCEWYFVTADRTALENARLVANYYSGAYINDYDFGNCRDSGWHLIFDMAVYNLTGDPYYLNASRIIVERVLERQTPGPRGWHRQMVPAHCYCTPCHRGACIYMMAVLCRGLETYYEATGDQRVADAIIGGAAQAVDEMWREEANTFAATSCPDVTEHPEWSGHYPHPVQMLLFAYLRTGRPRCLEIARLLMERSPRVGVDTVPWWSKAYCYLDLIDRKAAEEE